MKIKNYIFLLFPIFALASCSDDKDDEYAYDAIVNYDWTLAADSSTTALIDKFWNKDGNYFNYGNDDRDLSFHYWPNAHAMDVVIDAYLRTNDTKYSAYFDKWYAGVKAKNGNKYKNDFVDDMEWNALTMLRIYNITKDQKYLDTVLELWGYISGVWTEDAGGGITWCTSSSVSLSKNACSNGPAAILAARLYSLTGEQEYLDWAKKIYNWEKEILVDASTGKVKDNIDVATKKISEVALTYNQGTYMGAGVELYNITKNPAYLNDAKNVATYTISALANSNNVLRDEGSGDNGLFKGIFMRYFLELIQVNDLDNAYKNKYIVFLKNNAYTLWHNGVYKDGAYIDNLLFGTSWDTAPIATTQLTSQASGSMLMEMRIAYEAIKNDK